MKRTDKNNNFGNQRGQALIEMAVFGGIILIVFGILLNHMQQLRDQQYVQMESFRRALTYAAKFPLIDLGIGAGAAVDFSVVRNSRYVDLSDNYRKGSPQAVSGSSSVYWAVPKVGTQPYTLSVYRVNEDEQALNLSNLFNLISRSDIGKYVSFGRAGTLSQHSSRFVNQKRKLEDRTKITNQRTSLLKDQITTDMRSVFTPRIPIEMDDEAAQSLMSWLEGQLGQIFYAPQEGITDWKVTQRLYRKSNGEYSYSKNVPEDSQVMRSRQWETAQ